jgi:hypothetical protein
MAARTYKIIMQIRNELAKPTQYSRGRWFIASGEALELWTIKTLCGQLSPLLSIAMTVIKSARDRPAAKITPAMIEAGEAVLSRALDQVDLQPFWSVISAARDVYTAMEFVRFHQPLHDQEMRHNDDSANEK